MKTKVSSKNRKEIKAKMAAVLGESMEPLSNSYQEILLDDLVTAFENRLAVLLRAGAVQIGVEEASLVELEPV